MCPEGFIRNPSSYNNKCVNSLCNLNTLEDRDNCCMRGCETDKFLENGICNDCTRIENSKSDALLTCTSRYNSRFRDISSNDNCKNGYNPIR